MNDDVRSARTLTHRAPSQCAFDEFAMNILINAYLCRFYMYLQIILIGIHAIWQ